MRSSFSLSLLYHAYMYLEFLILACTIYILALTLVEPGVLFRLQADKETSLVLVDKRGFFYGRGGHFRSPLVFN